MSICNFSTVLGAGGCFRIPYLIGLRKALPVLLTGDPITSKRALQLGLVDALWTRTQSISPESSSKNSSPSICYKYEWIEELTECIQAGRIGKKKLNVQLANSGPLCENITVNPPEVSEESLLEEVSLSWSTCNEKASSKFQYRPVAKLTMTTPFRYMFDYLIYAVSAVSLYKRVRENMPAPYETLACTWRCYNSPSIEGAVMESSAVFARLIQTPESKNLMNLFLLARQLKKDSQAALVRPPSSTISCEVTVITGAECINYVSAFVQSLLYSDLKVAVLVDDPDKKGVWLKLVNGIEKQFGYSLSRGHMTKEMIESKMRSLCQINELEENDGMIIDACLSQKKRNYSNKVFYITFTLFFDY